MAEQAHAHLYRGLPPVVRHPGRHWLLSGVVVALAAVALAAPVFAFWYAAHSTPSSWWGGGGRSLGGNVQVFDWYSLVWIGGAFILGGVLGFRLVRGWWSMVALDALGFALWLGIMPSHGTLGRIYVWFFWVFGVSAGAGVRGLIERGRLRTSTVLAGIPLLVGTVSAVVLASERRPRWPGYRGVNPSFYVTPWWAYVGSVALGLLGVAFAVLIYRGVPRWLERHLPR